MLAILFNDNQQKVIDIWEYVRFLKLFRDTSLICQREYQLEFAVDPTNLESFLEAAKTGNIPQITFSNFSDLKNLSLEFQFTELENEINQFFDSAIPSATDVSHIISNSRYINPENTELLISKSINSVLENSPEQLDHFPSHTLYRILSKSSFTNVENIYNYLIDRYEKHASNESSSNELDFDLILFSCISDYSQLTEQQIYKLIELTTAHHIVLPQLLSYMKNQLIEERRAKEEQEIRLQEMKDRISDLESNNIFLRSISSNVIKESQFKDCHRLTTITIPNNVTTIEKGAFENCSELKSIMIPNSVTSIGEDCFKFCSSLTSITIPNSVESIEDCCFMFCSSLTSITIPNSVTSIGSLCFVGCSSLTSIRIPNSVTSIGKGCFGGCSSLTSITIPNSVTSIGDFSFGGCTSLSSIKIPNSVTSIGEFGFLGCSSLASIKIPNSVTSIGDFSFGGCSSLTLITLPNSVTSIGQDCFNFCSSLTSITISNSVTSIRRKAFANCSKLSSIKILENVNLSTESIVGGLETIIIPKNVNSLSEDAFHNCPNLVSFLVDSNNSSLSSVDGVLFSKDMKSLIRYPNNCPNTDYTIPNTVETILYEAFSMCNHLRAIKIPNSVRSIESYAFSDCTNLNSIEIPASVTKIETTCFCGCTKLASINTDSNNEFYTSNDGILFSKDMKTLIHYPSNRPNKQYSIPSNATRFDEFAFNNCSNLESITIPSHLKLLPFKCPSLKSLIVADNHSDYTSIDGILYSKNQTDLIYYPSNHPNTHFTIPESVICIDEGAINNCLHLTSINIGANLKAGLKYISRYCPNLESISLDPNNLNYTSVDGVLFTANQETLIWYPKKHPNKHYTVPENVKTIDQLAFSNCINLESITFPDIWEFIYTPIISNCPKLSSITTESQFFGIILLLWGIFFDCPNLSTCNLVMHSTIQYTIQLPDCLNLTEMQWKELSCGTKLYIE